MCTDMRETERDRQREKGERGRDKNTVCGEVCTCADRQLPQFESILGCGGAKCPAQAVRNQRFQVHMPRHIFMYLKNVQQRKKWGVGGKGWLHAYLCLRNSFLQTTIS